jgi:hypothetical protein
MLGKLALNKTHGRYFLRIRVLPTSIFYQIFSDEILILEIQIFDDGTKVQWK